MITELIQLLYAQPLEMGMLWEGGEGAGVAVWVPPGEAKLLAAPDHSAAARSTIHERRPARLVHALRTMSPPGRRRTAADDQVVGCASLLKLPLTRW